MSKYPARIALGFWLSAILTAQFAVADEDSIPLDDADRRAITLQVLKSNPMLASSPGIKFASANRLVGTADRADVLFYPHAESAGIKYAIHVQCRRQNPDELWTCDDVGLRRYVQLDSQDFELRVVGNIGIEVVHALVQATHATARTGAVDGAAIPEAAVIALPVDDGYLVSWGDEQGQQSIDVQAHLRKGGNPAVPDDWQTEIFQPEE